LDQFADQPAMGVINRAALLEPYPSERNELVGRDPRELSPADLAAAGIEAAPVLKIVRAKCLDCCGGSEKEVRLCMAIACPLWPLRMGSNPFREVSEGRAEPSSGRGSPKPEPAAPSADLIRR
jgi:hypothetical protein